MTLERIDNVSLVVEDLPAAIEFFRALGLELEGQTTVGGELVDRLLGLEGVRSEIAMLRAPAGGCRIELTRFHSPPPVGPEPSRVPPHALGLRRIMFSVRGIEEVMERLRAHGAEPLGDVVRYEDAYALCYLRGPEGILVALAEEL